MAERLPEKVRLTFLEGGYCFGHVDPVGCVATGIEYIRSVSQEEQAARTLVSAVFEASDVDELVRAADRLAGWAEEARGHHGIEECAGVAKPSTEWDAIQDGLAGSARHVRLALRTLTQGDHDAH